MTDHAAADNPALLAAALDLRKRRALFRATHRGTKEMDWLLGRFVADGLAGWTDDEMAGIEMVIEIGDPDLNAWILDPGSLTDPLVRPIVEAIRHFHGLAD